MMIPKGEVILISLVFFAVLFLIDLYVYKGIKAAFSSSAPGIRHTTKRVYWIVNFVFLLAAAYLLLTFSWKSAPSGYPLKILAGAFVLLYFPKIVFGFFLLGEDIYRVIRAGI